MVKLTDYITEDLVVIFEGPLEKQEFLERLVDHFVGHFPIINRSELLQKLNEREDSVSTGIGHGVAIPHASIKGLDEIQCMIAHIPKGVNFSALDSLPVHIAFLVLSPPNRTGDHLRLLARIARLISKGSFLSRIISAENAHEIYTITKEVDGRHV